MKRKTLIALCSAVLFVLTACQADDAGNGDGGDAADGPIEVELTISTHPLLDFSVPVMVGIEEGFFEEEGLEIKSVVGSEGGGTTVRNILTGDLEFGFVSLPAAIQANVFGARLPAITGGAKKVTTHMLVVPEDSDIDSLEEAVEQKATIGYTSPGSVTQALLGLALERKGIDAATVATRPTGGMGAGFTSALEGGIEVVSAIEPIFSLAGEGLRPIYNIAEDVDLYQQMVWAVNPEFMEENPEAVAGFLRALEKSIEWIADNVEEAARLWATEADIPVEAALTNMETMEEVAGIEEYYGSGFVPEAIQATVDSIVPIGLLEEGDVIPWEQIIVQDFLPDGADRVEDVSTLPQPPQPE